MPAVFILSLIKHWTALQSQNNAFLKFTTFMNLVCTIEKLFTGTLKALEHLGPNTQCMDNVYSLTGITN